MRAGGVTWDPVGRSGFSPDFSQLGCLGGVS